MMVNGAKKHGECPVERSEWQRRVMWKGCNSQHRRCVQFHISLEGEGVDELPIRSAPTAISVIKYNILIRYY